MGGLWAQLCFGSGILILSLIGILVSVFLRNLPQVLELVARLLRCVFMLSYRFYYVLLLNLDRLFKNKIDIKLRKNPIRVFLTISFSILIGCLVCLTFQWNIKAWFLGILALHGSFIGVAWKDFFEPHGLHLGNEV